MSHEQSATPLRVLYIEDNELVREITCDLIAQDAAREVVAVSTAEEALCVFRENHFDLVVTDLSLPAMSGFDLVRHVKKISPSMPIIVASGYPLDLDDCQLGTKVRAITKPFDALQLEALIQDLCSNTEPLSEVERCSGT